MSQSFTDLLNPVATWETTNFQQFLLFLPNPDLVLRKAGLINSAYQELLKDATVGGLARRRKSAVAALEYGIDPDYKGPAKLLESVQKMLARLPLRQIITSLLDAPLFGYAPHEVMYAQDGGKICITGLVSKPQDWFLYNPDGDLLLRRRDAVTGVQVPPYKFIVSRNDPTYVNPYGNAELGMCWWPAMFKKGGLKFWVTFTEKFGTPKALGKLPRGTGNQDEKEKLLDALEQLILDSVAVIPDDSSVELLEAKSGSVNADLFERLLMYCRSEISIALVGQNQTTEASANKASAIAGHEVTKDIRDGDVAIVEKAFNELIDFHCILNHGSAEGAPRFVFWEQEEVNEKQAMRDERLRRAGAVFTPAYFKRTYSLQDGDLDDQQMRNEQPDNGILATASSAESSSSGSASSAAFIEGGAAIDQEIVDQAVASLLELSPESGNSITQKIIEPIIAMLAESQDYNTALSKLDSLMPSLSTNGLEDALNRLMSFADTTGRLAVQHENETNT